jgi:sugar lactone lactonase YvrE
MRLEAYCQTGVTKPYRLSTVLHRRGLALVLAIASPACHEDRTLGEIVESNPPDAGPRADAGAGTPAELEPREAGAPDAGPPDAGPPDAGPPDAGPPDATTNAACDRLPTNLPYRAKRGPPAAPDFVFDREGMLISIKGGRGWKTPFSGVPRLFVSVGTLGDDSYGTRILPNGDLVVAMASSRSGFLLRIQPDGRSSMFASLFNGANAIEVDLQGFVYVAELARKQVVRVDGATGAATVLVNGNGLEFPRAVAFSPDYRTLYVGELSNGNIFALEMKPDGTAGAMRRLAGGVAAGALKGMAVDECGNVYVTGYDTSAVYRVAPGGGTPELVADLSDLSMSISGLQWGSGVGGWDPSILYVIDGDQDRVYELDVGVRGKRAPHLP